MSMWLVMSSWSVMEKRWLKKKKQNMMEQSSNHMNVCMWYFEWSWFISHGDSGVWKLVMPTAQAAVFELIVHCLKFASKLTVLSKVVWGLGLCTELVPWAASVYPHCLVPCMNSHAFLCICFRYGIIIVGNPKVLSKVTVMHFYFLTVIRVQNIS